MCFLESFAGRIAQYDESNQEDAPIREELDDDSENEGDLAAR